MAEKTGAAFGIERSTPAGPKLYETIMKKRCALLPSNSLLRVAKAAKTLLPSRSGLLRRIGPGVAKLPCQLQIRQPNSQAAQRNCAAPVHRYKIQW